MLASLAKVEGELADPKSERNPKDLTPAYAQNQHRSIKPEYLVAVGICSHLGCSPITKFETGTQPSLPDSWTGGFLCHVTVQPLIWQDAYSRTNLHQTTWKCRHTCM
jgi:ubiquinol-cytochrome c reductase iron-sulfur subunit